MKIRNAWLTKSQSLVFWIFCLSYASSTGNLSETTPTADKDNITTTADDASVSAHVGYNIQRSTAMAALLSSIQSRPEVLQKVPPVVEDSAGTNRIKLRLEYAVLAVLGADDVLQTIKMAVYLKLSWVNPALAWNPSEHCGIDSLMFPTGSIWAPRLLLMNSVTHVDLVETFGNGLIVSSDGNVTTLIPVCSETVCAMDLTRYPYDEQFCPLMFNVVSFPIDWEVEESNEKQEILNNTGFGNIWHLEGIEKKHFKTNTLRTSIIVIHIKRKTTFYTTCLVLPIVVTSYLNTLVFLIPPESGEKISFFVSVFVSSSVFLSFFIEVMPRGLGDTPDIMKLLLGATVEAILILFATIFILRRFHQEEASSSASKRSDRDDNRVHPLPPVGAAHENRVRDSCTPEEKQGDAMQKDCDCSRSVARTFSASSRQLDRLCFIMSLVSNTIFLVYLLLDFLWPKITKTL